MSCDIITEEKLYSKNYYCLGDTVNLDNGRSFAIVSRQQNSEGYSYRVKWIGDD